MCCSQPRCEVRENNFIVLAQNRNLCSTQNIYGKASLVAHTGVQSLCQTTSEGTERQRDKERKQQQKTGMTTKANKKRERDTETIRYDDKQRHMKTERERKQTQV